MNATKIQSSTYAIATQAALADFVKRTMPYLPDSFKKEAAALLSLQPNTLRPSNWNDLVGHRFGLWTVVSLAGCAANGHQGFVCECECGVRKSINGYSLLQGRSQSCGCLRRNILGARAFKHGESNGPSGRTAEYRCWAHMIKRCSNPKCKEWPRYGGRGIKVCDSWKNYQNFLADMGRRPTPSHSLDRIDVDGNYEPGNVRWATHSEQAQNRRTSIKNLPGKFPGDPRHITYVGPCTPDEIKHAVSSTYKSVGKVDVRIATAVANGNLKLPEAARFMGVQLRSLHDRVNRIKHGSPHAKPPVGEASNV